MAKAPKPYPLHTITKKARMIKMLSGKKPVSIEKLSSTLEWQTHTIRAALSRLKVDGMELVSEKPNQKTRLYALKIIIPQTEEASTSATTDHPHTKPTITAACGQMEADPAIKKDPSPSHRLHRPTTSS